MLQLGVESSLARGPLPQLLGLGTYGLARSAGLWFQVPSLKLAGHDEWVEEGEQLLQSHLLTPPPPLIEVYLTGQLRG